MKKLLVMLMMLAMMTALTLPALAATTTVTATIDEPEIVYAVVVTQSIEFTEPDVPQEIGVTLTALEDEFYLPEGKTVEVSVAGSGDEGAFTIASADDEMVYTVSKDDETWLEIAPNALVAELDTEDESQKIYAQIATDVWSDATPGDYAGTLTYTIGLVG